MSARSLNKECADHVQHKSSTPAVWASPVWASPFPVCLEHIYCPAQRNINQSLYHSLSQLPATRDTLIRSIVMFGSTLHVCSLAFWSRAFEVAINCCYQTNSLGVRRVSHAKSYYFSYLYPICYASTRQLNVNVSIMTSPFAQAINQIPDLQNGWWVRVSIMVLPTRNQYGPPFPTENEVSGLLLILASKARWPEQ